MPIPLQLSQYRIEAHLGDGRYAVTCRAVDAVRKRTVALKLLHAYLLKDPQDWSRFIESAQPAADLVHPHIAWLWEANEFEGQYYLAERYASGPSLAQILAQTGALTWAPARQALGQLVQALEFAHARGWIHGAIHPGNILIGPELGAVLSDFALDRAARLLHIIQPSRYPLYIAPELRLGQPPGPPADQYALACTIIDMLSERGDGLPVAGNAEARASIENDPLTTPAIPTAWPPGAPRGLGAVLTRALAFDPAARYSSMGAFLAAIDQLAPQPPDEEQIRAWREGQAQARRKAEEDARQQDEDAARLAALEQARREIEAQINKPPAEVETPAVAASVPEPVLGEAVPENAQPAPRRRRARRNAWRRLWPVWVGAFLVTLVLAGSWLDGRLPRSSLFPPSATPTSAPPSATFSATPTATATASPSATFTITATATSTPTKTATHTLSPTPSETATPSPTSTPRPTLTPFPRENQNNPREP